MMAVTILLILLYFAVAFLVNRHYLHVFQLSSYQAGGFFRTLKKEPQALELPLGAVLLYLAINVRNDLFFLSVFAAIMMGFAALCYRITPSKKKLVLTDRMKRLITTVAVVTALCGLLGWVMWFFPHYRSVAGKLVALYYGFLPLIVPFAGGINAQDEKKINERFMNEAQGMLMNMENLRIIGITGSFGKTSVKYALSTILEEQFRVLMTPESWNTPMGITRCVREQLKPYHEIFVCEMGARHTGDIEEITRFVNPDDGIVTAIGEQHLETFRSVDNILKAKTDLLRAVGEKHPALKRRSEKGKDGAAPKGVKLINGDNETLLNYCASDYAFADVVTYGFGESNDYRVKDMRLTIKGTTFTLVTPDGTELPLQTELIGAHNVLNIAGAVAMAKLCGMEDKKIAAGVKRLKSVPHRLELKRSGKVTILDDAYNANPAGAKVALETLAMFETSLRIAVTPGLVELGERQEELNRALGQQAAESCDVLIIVNEVNARALKEGALAAGFPEKDLHLCKTFDEANALMTSVSPGRERVILLLNDLPDNYR